MSETISELTLPTISTPDNNSRLIQQDMQKIINIFSQCLAQYGTVYNAEKINGKTLPEITDILKQDIITQLVVENPDPIIVDPDGENIIVNNINQFNNVFNRYVDYVSDIKIKTIKEINIELYNGSYSILLPDNFISIVGLYLNKDNITEEFGYKLDRPFLYKYDIQEVYDTSLSKKVKRLYFNEKDTVSNNSLVTNTDTITLVYLYRSELEFEYNDNYIEFPIDQNTEFIYFSRYKPISYSFSNHYKLNDKNERIINNKLPKPISFNQMRNNKFTNNRSSSISPKSSNNKNIIDFIKNEILNNFDQKRIIYQKTNSNIDLSDDLITRLLDANRLIIIPSKNTNKKILNINKKSNYNNNNTIYLYIDNKIDIHTLYQSFNKLFFNFGSGSQHIVIQSLINDKPAISINIYDINIKNKLIELFYRNTYIISYKNKSNIIYKLEDTNLFLKTFNDVINMKKYDKKYFNQFLDRSVIINYTSNIIKMKQKVFTTGTIAYNIRTRTNLFRDTVNIISQRNINNVSELLYKTFSLLPILDQYRLGNIYSQSKLFKTINYNIILKSIKFNKPFYQLQSKYTNDKIVNQLVYRPINFDRKRLSMLPNLKDFYMTNAADQYGYYDLALGLKKVYQKKQDIICEEGQKHFRFEYDPLTIDISLNGQLLLKDDDYLALNGKDLYLNVATKLNDILQVRSYGKFLVADSFTKNETLDLIREQKLGTPILEGSNELFENTILSLNIINFDRNNKYTLSSPDIYIDENSYQLINSTYFIKLPEVQYSKIIRIHVMASREGYWNSHKAEHIMIVRNLYYTKSDISLVLYQSTLNNSNYLKTLENLKFENNLITQITNNQPSAYISKNILQDEINDWKSVEFNTETEHQELEILNSVKNEYLRDIYSTPKQVIIKTQNLTFSLEPGIKLLVFQDDLKTNIYNDNLNIKLRQITISKITPSNTTENDINGFSYAILDISGYYFTNNILRAFINTTTLYADLNKEGKTSFEHKELILQKSSVQKEFKIELTGNNSDITIEDLHHRHVIYDNEFLPIDNIYRSNELLGSVINNDVTSNNLIIPNTNQEFNITNFSSGFIFEREGYLYLVGGYIKGVENNSIYKYDPKFKILEFLTDIPGNRKDYACDMTNNISEQFSESLLFRTDLKIYISGGITTAGSDVGNLRNDLICFDLYTKNWITVQPNYNTILHYQCQHHIQVIDKNIFFLTGYLLENRYMNKNDKVIDVRYDRYTNSGNYHDNYNFRVDQRLKYPNITNIFPIYNFNNGLDDDGNLFPPIDKIEFNCNYTTEKIIIELWEKDINDTTNYYIEEDLESYIESVTPPPSRILEYSNSEIRNINKSIYETNWINNNNFTHSPAYNTQYERYSSGSWNRTGGFFNIDSYFFWNASQTVGKVVLPFNIKADEDYRIRLRFGHNIDDYGVKIQIGTKFLTFRSTTPVYDSEGRISYYVSDWDATQTLGFKSGIDTNEIIFFAGSRYRIYEIEIFDAQIYIPAQEDKKIIAYRTNVLLSDEDDISDTYSKTLISPRVHKYNVNTMEYTELNHLPMQLLNSGVTKRENLLIIYGGRKTSPTIKFSKQLSKNDLNDQLLVFDTVRNVYNTLYITKNISYDHIDSDTGTRNFNIPQPLHFPKLSWVGDYLIVYDGIKVKNINYTDTETSNTYMLNNTIYFYNYKKPKLEDLDSSWIGINIETDYFGLELYSNPEKEGNEIIFFGGTKDIPTSTLHINQQNVMEAALLGNTVNAYSGKKLQLLKDILYFTISKFKNSVNTTALTTLILKTKAEALIPYEFILDEIKSQSRKVIITKYGKLTRTGRELIFKWTTILQEKLKSLIIGFIKE